MGKVIHTIVDNYATHKHLKVRQWLARHPRWTFHFTSTSASWLNAVEGFFAKLTRQRLKRGVFRSVIDLQVAINRFVAETNLNPKHFVWTADLKRVIAAVKRGKQTLEVSTRLLTSNRNCFRSAELIVGETNGAEPWVLEEAHYCGYWASRFQSLSCLLFLCITDYCLAEGLGLLKQPSISFSPRE